MWVSPVLCVVYGGWLLQLDHEAPGLMIVFPSFVVTSRCWEDKCCYQGLLNIGSWVGDQVSHSPSVALCNLSLSLSLPLSPSSLGYFAQEAKEGSTSSGPKS